MAEALTPEEIRFARALVIYEDAQLIAFNKPAGLSSQGGRIAARTLDDLLVAFASAAGVKPRLIHRLDRDTSGLILTARTKAAAAFLGKAMMARRVKKTYLAIVAPGGPALRESLIDTPLRRESVGREAYMRTCDPAHPDAVSAITRYRTLSANDVAALVELSPRTGRMHQLRVHLASIGRPIAGDARYGGALSLAGAAVPRLMLHAAGLAFTHPAGGPKSLAAPMPADMAALLSRLGLAAPPARNTV
ncbi:MAG TPA: RluA family pseudouridine synthase [Caulobacteraceae bacterium]